MVSGENLVNLGLIECIFKTISIRNSASAFHCKQFDTKHDLVSSIYCKRIFYSFFLFFFFCQSCFLLVVFFLFIKMSLNKCIINEQIVKQTL